MEYNKKEKNVRKDESIQLERKEKSKERSIQRKRHRFDKQYLNELLVMIEAQNKK